MALCWTTLHSGILREGIGAFARSGIEVEIGPERPVWNVDFQIRGALAGDQETVELTPVPVARLGDADGEPDRRLHREVRDNFEFVWRLLRRLGLSPSDADDATQQVFIVLARKINDLSPGKERAFLYGTAVRIAWRARRTLERRREELSPIIADEAGLCPAPDQLLLHRQARAVLDEILGAMPLAVRTVFVLFELEGLNLSEIAETLRLPRGTVASRLRRGREDFQRRVQRIERSIDPTGSDS
ncbi:MAG TPA: sigma-70 family RNA polymerase sigma factor [Polyangiaceae bacterium]